MKHNKLKKQKKAWEWVNNLEKWNPKEKELQSSGQNDSNLAN